MAVLLRRLEHDAGETVTAIALTADGSLLASAASYKQVPTAAVLLFRPKRHLFKSFLLLPLFSPPPLLPPSPHPVFYVLTSNRLILSTRASQLHVKQSTTRDCVVWS
jgi:hypothetical protein